MSENQDLLRKIPKVDSLITDSFYHTTREKLGNDLFLSLAREILEGIRTKIRGNKLPKTEIEQLVQKEAIKDSIEETYQKLFQPALCRVINATGIVLHTGLGRAVLPKEAMERVYSELDGYSILEVDHKTGERSEREQNVVGLLTRLTGAESATVVNNNAGAVLLSLTALAGGKETVVSRGELIEIGGSFRMPDVMAQGYTKLVEVGTTNKTYIKDYEEKINPNTALLMHAHTSNYRIVGFTAVVSIDELVALGAKHNIPVMDDIGSGNLLDLKPYGIEEPLVQESVKTGVDVVTFSGDKLLGGPQAGIIVGKKKHVSIIRKHPLFRALRPGKFTLVALEATLKMFLNPDRLLKDHPTLRMLTKPLKEIERDANALKGKIEKLSNFQVIIVDDFSEAGGGSMPVNPLKTKALAIKHKSLSPDELSTKLRLSTPPVFARISKDKVMFDPRTLLEGEIDTIVNLLQKL